ncbi:MAG: VTT domain-containing protein [Chthoniobacteraceae bacterium]
MSRIQRAFRIQLVGLVIATLIVAWLVRTFPVADYITRAQNTIGSMEIWGGVLYPVLFATCNLLLLPGGIVAIGSGLFFGLWWGFLLNIVGSLAAAAAAFGISRAVGRQWIERRFFRDPKWAALDTLIARDGWKIIFLSQVHPLFPTSLLSYLYGITRIRFRTCLLWIALGQAPGLFLYAYLGTLAQFGLKILRGKSHPFASEYVLWIGGLVLTLAVTIALARMALKILAEAEAEADRSVNELEPVATEP